MIVLISLAELEKCLIRVCNINYPGISGIHPGTSKNDVLLWKHALFSSSVNANSDSCSLVVHMLPNFYININNCKIKNIKIKRAHVHGFLSHISCQTTNFLLVAVSVESVPDIRLCC